MAGFKWRNVFNFVAFVAVVLIGVALLLAGVGLDGKLADAFRIVAEIMAYVVVIFYSFFYAWSRSRRNYSQVIHLCIWAAAFILILIMIILRYA